MVTCYNIKGVSDEEIVYDETVMHEIVEEIDNLYTDKIYGLANKVIAEGAASMFISKYNGEVDYNPSVDDATFDCVKESEKFEETLNDVKLHGLKICKEDLPWIWGSLIHDAIDNINVQGTTYRSGIACSKSPVQQDPLKIGDSMNDLYEFNLRFHANPFIKTCIIHFYVLYIAPFCDGNGRLARFMSGMVMLDTGYRFMADQCICTSILISGVKDYYDSFYSCVMPNKDGVIDITKFIMYMLNTYKDYLERV